MGRAFKVLFIAVAAIFVLLIAAAGMFVLVFDPNDFREEIATAVETKTGRELAIEGDLELSLFPWVAIDVGRTRLGNAEGFGDEPFATFERARLSVRLLPALLRREISVGTAALESLHLNLAVDASGGSNWQDLVEESSEEPDAAETEPSPATITGFDVQSVSVADASLVYTDAQSGERYVVEDLNLSSGRIDIGEPVPLEGALRFAAEPQGVAGEVTVAGIAGFDAEAANLTLAELLIEGSIEGLMDVPAEVRVTAPLISVDTAEQTADPGNIEIDVFGVMLSATFEPFSYAGVPTPVAEVEIAEFSPRRLMTDLGIEPPITADPEALTRVRLAGRAAVGESAITLTDLALVLDDTTLTGQLSVPREDGGTYQMDLRADRIDLTRYMAPAEAEADAEAAADEPPVEIPVELLRPLNARGSFVLAEAVLGDLLFQDVEVGVAAAGGKLRLHPIGARFFDGRYVGDVRLDVSGASPLLSVDEKIEDVSLTPLAVAMFERDNISGRINGAFKLAGRGENFEAMQRSLSGTVSLSLADGIWEGTDIWYEVRRARALLKQEPPPEAPSPPQTRFSSVRTAGTVTDGVLKTEDLLAELPFMQVTGGGTVDLVEATLDYALTGRVLERPEFASGASDTELDELTEAVIPFTVTGALSSPKVRPDLGKMVRGEVEGEVKKRVLDLLGGDEEPAAEGEAPAEEEEKDVEEQLKDEARKRLRNLLGDP